MANPMPAAEVEITTGLARRLLRAQQPDLAGPPSSALLPDRIQPAEHAR